MRPRRGISMTNHQLDKFSYLIVDDDDLACDLMTSTLHRLGASQVHVANAADRALQLAQQHRPDFILLDIYMPEVDGWTLLDQLRQLLPPAAVLMVTGSRYPEDFTYSVDQRAHGYCIKPVMPDVLEKSLLNAYQRRHGRLP